MWPRTAALSTRRGRARSTVTKRHAAPVVTIVVLLVVYSLTLAPGVTLWDSGEFLAAIKTLGIPHPAGTSLYVLIAKCWSFVFAPLFGFARAVNLFSAAATAGACGVIALLFAKWSHDAIGGTCAGLVAGAMSTVWLSANETEVYALAFLFGCAILWCANRSGALGESRWALVAIYLGGLGWALHLSVLVVVPAAAVLIFADRDGTFGLPRGRRRTDGRRDHQSLSQLAIAAIVVFALGASCVLYLYVRAKHDPAINQGNPSSLAALRDVLTRKQYGPRTLLPRSVPLWLQIGNLFEYADWQFALGVSDSPGPSLERTSITLAFVALGIYGSISHRRADRRSWRAWLTLLIVGSVGVAIYLNMKAGPSYGYGFLPDGTAREARERDYFFFFAFAAWGAWAGLGAARLSRRVPSPLRSLPLAFVALPFVLNWKAVDRSHLSEDVGARDEALSIIQPLPPNAVLLSIGDNDTYPLWYLQQVEGIRRDVTVVTIPLLSATWYRAELARRYGLLTPADVAVWRGAELTQAAVAAHATALGRPVVESPIRDGVLH